MPSPASHVIQQLGRDVTGIEPMTVLVFLVQRKRFGLVVTETGMLCRGRSTERERETSVRKIGGINNAISRDLERLHLWLY